MNPYDRFVLPRLIDCCCGMKWVQELRAEIIPKAQGQVLEIGIGTGRNLPFYQRHQVTRLHGLDPAEQMSAAARRRAERSGIDTELMTLSAERIPVADHSFDTVVCTFTLCSIPDPAAALGEMRRVLKPDGKLLFCEHGRAPDAPVQSWQDRLTPWWKHMAGGCHLNRDTPSLLADNGFRTTKLEQSYVSRPRFMCWVSRGAASPA